MRAKIFEMAEKTKSWDALKPLLLELIIKSDLTSNEIVDLYAEVSKVIYKRKELPTLKKTLEKVQSDLTEGCE